MIERQCEYSPTTRSRVGKGIPLLPDSSALVTPAASLVAASLLSGIQFFSGHAAMGTQQFGDGLEWGTLREYK
jgi:hypothetical protein